MRIKQVTPTALGAGRAAIDEFHKWWLQTDGTMRADMPHFARQVFLSPTRTASGSPTSAIWARLLHQRSHGRQVRRRSGGRHPSGRSAVRGQRRGWLCHCIHRPRCARTWRWRSPSGMNTPLHVAYYRIIVPVKFLHPRPSPPSI
ncbi:MAG: hypothetical protein HPM95_07730 [Alphaproteobacteria bacterium]|nr:hypothetical protein [Alphaproteobacteria bacterium]